ncbi:MAG: hypothetical protein ACQESX_10040 [Bacteroidota bacterium]
MFDIPLKTNFPIEYSLVAIAAGLLYAGVLYWRNPNSRFPRSLRYGLFFLRFVVVSVLAFLLLMPMIQSTKYYEEKPGLILAMDNSESMTLKGMDSATLQKEWKALQERLSDEFDLKTYRFSGEADTDGEPDFQGEETDIYNALSTINEQHRAEETSALVLLTDGIYNRGTDPAYAPLDPAMKLIAVGSGDPRPEMDIKISQVRSNDVVFSGNEFPVEVHVRASKAAGENAELVLQKAGSNLATERFSVDSDNFSKRFTFYPEAEGEGMQRYTVSVSPLPEEENTANNTRNVYIDVIDEQASVLFLAASPHPDLFAMKAAIESRPQYKVTTALIDSFDEAVTDYDLVVMHQLPSNQGESASVLATVYGNEIPVLFVLGGQTNYQLFNSMDAGLDIEGFEQQYNNALAGVNEDFALFRLSPDVQNLLNESPPLKAPFGDYKSSPVMDVMLYQKLSDYTTSMPLVALSGRGSQKQGIIAGTGIWRWRMRDYTLNKHHQSFDGWFYSIVKYLAINQDRDFFRVYADAEYSGREEVKLTAELYNASYERINDPEVQLELRNEDGETFEYLFDRKDDSYSLNLNYLPEGTYQYAATTEFSGEQYKKDGAFVVSTARLESLNTVADFTLLQKLASRQEGFFIRDSLMNRVADSLLADEAYSPVRHEEVRFRPLIDEIWVLIGLLMLLTAEWFLRKYHGGY